MFAPLIGFSRLFETRLDYFRDYLRMFFPVQHGGFRAFCILLLKVSVYKFIAILLCKWKKKTEVVLTKLTKYLPAQLRS